MPLKNFNIVSRIICFDDRDTRPARHARGKLAAFRQVWDKWVCRLQLMYNPGTDVTVDERLVLFRGRCGFKQCMPSKPGKYGLKISVGCNAQTSYAWNMQINTGKPVEAVPLGTWKRTSHETTPGTSPHASLCQLGHGSPAGCIGLCSCSPSPITQKEEVLILHEGQQNLQNPQHHNLILMQGKTDRHTHTQTVFLRF